MQLHTHAYKHTSEIVKIFRKLYHVLKIVIYKFGKQL